MNKSRQPFLRKCFSIAGSLLGAAGIYFVAAKLMRYGGGVDLKSFTISECLTLSSVAVAYGASSILLALGWFCVVKHLGGHITKRWAVWAYGVSQLAKYVPGNIFHIAGRQAVGVGAGLSHKVLIKSSVGELALISSATVIFIIPAMQRWVSVNPAVTVSIFTILSLTTYYGVYKFGGKLLGHSFLCYSLFLFVSGNMFAVIFYTISSGETSFETMVLVFGGYNIAWLCGLVTPGAPAGIGVRELVLLFLLGPQADKPSLLLAIVVGRAVTVLGDMLFYFATLLFMSAQRQAVLTTKQQD